MRTLFLRLLGPAWQRCIMVFRGPMDDDLRSALDAGDIQAAVALLHRTHDSTLRRYVTHRVAAAEVEDLVQEVWVAARTALPRFRHEASPRTWLLRIARNKLADGHRRRRSIETFDSALVGEPLASVLLQRRAGASTALRQAERAEALHEVLDDLAVDDRELLELRYIVGLKPGEIVRLLELDVPSNTLSQRIVRLVKSVRETLLERDEFASRGSPAQ